MHRPGYPLGKLHRGVAVGVAELFLGQARCAAEVSSPLEARVPEVGLRETRDEARERFAVSHPR